MDQPAPTVHVALGASRGAPLAAGFETSVQHFELGAVLSHPTFGEVILSGSILAKWQTLNGQADAGGFSVQDVIGTALGDAQTFLVGGKPGSAQYFERGMIVQRPEGTAFVVYGDIYGRYRQLGDVHGSLGLPKTDEMQAGSGGRSSEFDNGTIFWSGGTGPKVVGGAIRDRYVEMGGPSSFLGCPTSDEQPVYAASQPGKPLVEIGRCNLFSGGGIWWTPAHGAWAMPGYVVDYWRQHGGPAGRFGFPTNGLVDRAGSTFMEFERGLIAFTPQGTFPIFDLNVRPLAFESNFDDIHVELFLTSNDAKLNQHFWVPSSDHFASNPKTDSNYTGLTVSLVRLDTSVTLQASGYGHHTFGKDERLGTYKATYDIGNLWGLRDAQVPHPATENVNSDYHFNTTVHIATSPLDSSPRFRRSKWWPFKNFDTPELSQHQMAQTFTDVSEDESTFWHPFDAAFYQFVYKSSAKKGTCFGMCLEALYAEVERSVFPEPIFDSPFIDYPTGLAGGDPLDAPSEPAAQTARFSGPCQIKFGYQLGHPMVDFALGKYVSGGVSDAVSAFHESRDAFGRGDFPILSLTAGGLGSAGHAIVPYRWDDTKKPWRIWVANPNAPASRIDSDDDPQNVVLIDPDRNAFSFQVNSTESYHGGRPGPGMIMSVPFHLVSSEPSTPFWEVVAALVAATAILLIFADDGSATTQISDGQGKTALQPDGTSFNLDAATRLPSFAPVTIFNPPPDGSRVETFRLVHPTPYRKAGATTAPADVPAASLAYAHTVKARGAYRWGLKGPGGSTMVEVPAGSATDTFQIANLGRPGQSVGLRSTAAKTAKMTVCGGRPGASEMRLFEIDGVPVGPAETISVHLEEAGQHLVVQNAGAEAKVSLRIQSGGNAAQAVAKSASLPAASVVRIAPDTWVPADLPRSAVSLDVLDHVGGSVLHSMKL